MQNIKIIMDNIICGIYKITSPSGKIYIGQSINIKSRWKYYEKLRCNKQFKIYHSLKKYGPENHSFDILKECSKDELNYYEKYYIDLFGSFNSDTGLNLKDGGGPRGILSHEARLNRSKVQRNNAINSKGYSFNKKCNKYVARMSIFGKFIQLGRFDREIDAINAYKVAMDNFQNNNFEEYYKSIAPKKIGYYFNKTLNIWRTKIVINNSIKQIGYFKKESSIALIYNAYINGMDGEEMIELIKQTRISDKL